MISNVEIQKISGELFIVSYNRKEGMVSFTVDNNLNLNFLSIPQNADIDKDIVPLFYEIIKLYAKDKVGLMDKEAFSSKNENEKKKIFELFLADIKSLTNIQIKKEYHGRYQYIGPAIISSDLSVMLKISIPCVWDNFGKDFIIYPKI